MPILAAAWASSPTSGARAFRLVKETRGALSAVLMALVGAAAGANEIDDQLEYLSLSWAAAVSRSRLVLDSSKVGARWVAGHSPTFLVPERVTRAAVELLCDVDLTHLGICPVEEGGCGWLFIDRSKNKSRRWCSMEFCGTEAKARRLRDRRREMRAASHRGT